MSEKDKSTVLLEYYLKKLKLPTMLREYASMAAICQKVVAEHKRSWGKGGVFFNYLHYLPLLERKPGSLDYSRPLMDLKLPECFEVLRRRLVVEEKKENEGTREFIRILRFLEDYPMTKFRKAVKKGLQIRGHSRDIIDQFLISHFTWKQTTFLLANRHHLRMVKAARPDITAYRALLYEGGAS